MSRIARIVVPGLPHHVTQRGNRRADVFLDDEDRRAYLRYLKEYADSHGLAVWAYCLMTNHVHFVAAPAREESLSTAFRDAHTVYAMRFNSRCGLSGHVWQGRFFSTVLDEAHLWAAVRYVERNPVRAGMVSRAEDYPWSSALARCGAASDPLLSSGFPPPGVVDDWAAWLRDEDDADAVQRIRQGTHTGRPCGDESFFDRLERTLQKPLGPKKAGRKPNAAPKAGHDDNQEEFNW